MAVTTAKRLVDKMVDSIHTPPRVQSPLPISVPVSESIYYLLVQCTCVFVCSVYPSIHVSVWLFNSSFYPYSSVYAIHPSTYIPFINPLFHRHLIVIHPSIHLSVPSSIHYSISIQLSIHSSICSIHYSIHLFHPSIHLSVHYMHLLTWHTT